MPTDFEIAFRRAQTALGLGHYDVKFAADPGQGNYATIDADAASCTAVARLDLDLCAKDGVTESVAVHECLHLMLADFRHAVQISSEAGDWLEEQTVRKLEGIVFRGLSGALNP